MTSITIRCVSLEGIPFLKTIDAKLVGGLAVHLADDISTDDGKPAFSVAHIATGMKLSDLYFETADVAEAYAEVLQKLPVDWYSRTVTDDYRRPHLIPALTSIAALFGGFLVETPIDQPPAGSA
ncbi:MULTISPECIES: hypothetical protein [unclassified Mesorhizobium]|uniref:hypothetical protein n=1 Tax=unclassified Mesorhizobium TaxID=325217 RepID=UPI000A635B8B|nr:MULTISPECIES: hypothetical protein [unclassified Mesorhizobium]MBN9255243.1 hypothetical protein [Mesorhizobium sp.]MBN9271010.1 hypothetical protein [Mesorhizobium sp.]